MIVFIRKLSIFSAVHPVLYLNFFCPGIDPLPEQPPARQAVAVVTEVRLVLAAHIDGDDRPGAHVSRNVRCWTFNINPEKHKSAAKKQNKVTTVFVDPIVWTATQGGTESGWA